MITLKAFYKASFYLTFLTIFLFGGFLQFFLGISNTGMTLLLILLMLFNYLLYAVFMNKIVLNKVIIFYLFYVSLIFISGVINETSLFKILLYTLFPSLPLSIYLFFFVNTKTNFISRQSIVKLFLYIALIQLPVLLIQRFGYDFLIGFNRSGQQVASFDFLFGTFFLKSDHSLGFFLILVISAILLNINNLRRTLPNPMFIVIYLSVTIVIAESNISKALLAIVWFLLLFFLFYRKIRNSKYFIPILTTVSIVLAVAAYSARDLPFVIRKMGGSIESHFSPERSYRFYEQKTAKREHIVVAAATMMQPKYLGEGPYSYFDITTGKFAHTIHFSQLIWTYFDLGIFGVISFLMFLAVLVKALKITDSIGILALLGISLIYSFYTTIFSEIAIIFSLFLICQQPPNESTYSPVPRLEEK